MPARLFEKLCRCQMGWMLQYVAIYVKCNRHLESPKHHRHLISKSPTSLRVSPKRVPRDFIAYELFNYTSSNPLTSLRKCSKGMLWSRTPLPRSICSSRYLRNPLRIVVHLDSIPLPEPPTLSREPRQLLRHWIPPQTDRTRLGKMAPKQATLGYVTSGQQTLGCGAVN